ncbi:MAG TPA: response regulator [Candidatus Dormibacteraeota bacterium]|nr:response regulator [Candidatus Dormibacteraeota bacterium]
MRRSTSADHVYTHANPSDVLIVQEDIAFARQLEAELLAIGLTAARAADMATAEQLLHDGMKPRAIVLDLMLPGAEGEEFLATLGARTGDRFPTIVLTVKNLGPAEIAILKKAGAAAALPKEFGATQATVALILQALWPRLVKL